MSEKIKRSRNLLMKVNIFVIDVGLSKRNLNHKLNHLTKKFYNSLRLEYDNPNDYYFLFRYGSIEDTICPKCRKKITMPGHLKDRCCSCGILYHQAGAGVTYFTDYYEDDVYENYDNVLLELNKCQTALQKNQNCVNFYEEKKKELTKQLQELKKILGMST